jgi:hypothetical protein
LQTEEQDRLPATGAIVTVGEKVHLDFPAAMRVQGVMQTFARHRMVRLLVAFVISLLGLCATGQGQAANVLELAPCAAQDKHETRTISGLFRVHVVCDRLLLEIPPALFYRDMLMYTEFSQLWSADTDITPGAMADSWVVIWHRRATAIHLEVIDYQRRANNAPAIERGIQACQLGYLIKSFDIIGEGDGGAPIIDVTSLFMGDVPDFAQSFKRRLRMATIDPQRSYLDNVKVFPNNVLVKYFHTWVPDPKDLTRPWEADESAVWPGIPFVFTTNFLLLPEQPMKGRYWDARVGYYSVDFDDYGTELPWRVARGLIMRYRLEKKDPAAPVSEPVQPIVFYLSPEVPERWRPYIKQGIEAWQPVFEAAGFRHAIVARDAPTASDDPSWDPEDARYSVLRWSPSSLRNALAPSLVDPRSGEIISSHVIFWHDVLRLVESWYFTQAGAVDRRAQSLPMPDALMGELLRYVVTHEIGHTLGLRHNFKAASGYSVEQLRDPAWTRRWGTSPSITSYARFNYVAQPGDGAALMPQLGPYDLFAIDWGYRPLPGSSPQDEWPVLDRLAARQIDEPMLRFGGEDAAAQVDPAVTGYTLGSDPIAAADLGLRNVDRLMDVLVPATSRLGHDYSHMASLYEDLVAHRHRQLAAVARLVGGVRETRYQAGRGGPPFVPVEPQQARAAVKFLCARAFASPGRLLDPEVLLRSAPEGWADAVQGSNLKLLTQLIDPGVFQRLSEAQALRTPTGAYLGVDLLADLNDALFSELADADIAIGLYRREIQRSYVTLLVALAREKEEPGKPMRRPYRSPDQPPDRLPAGHGPALMQDGAPPDLAAAGRASRLAPGHPSEFRAALLDAAQTLSRRIKGAQPKVHDRATAAHLADLLKALGEIV